MRLAIWFYVLVVVPAVVASGVLSPQALTPAAPSKSCRMDTCANAKDIGLVPMPCGEHATLAASHGPPRC